MADITTIARPYAKAAFDFAVENSAVDQWAEMLAFAGQVAADDTMAKLLTNTNSGPVMAEMFIQVGGEQLNEHGQNLVKVMAQNGRLTVLPEVAELFALYRDEYLKEIEAEVISATELSDEKQAALAASLEKRLARKVKLNCSIDKSLVAGVVIKAGDLVIDGSVRGKLTRLGDQLQS